MAATFTAITKYAYIKTRLKDIQLTDRGCASDYKTINQACHVLSSINRDISLIVFDEETLENSLFTNEDVSPSVYMDTAHFLLRNIIEEYDNRESYQLSNIRFRVAVYEIDREVEALYLIISLSIVRFSIYFTNEISNMAEEMIKHFCFLLKNGRVLDYRINTKSIKSVPVKDRKSKDNTTQLIIIYGYGNFDIYYLRFDFPHAGQPSAHFNNISPGKIKTYLFTEEEFNNIKKEHPKLLEFFFTDGDQHSIIDRCEKEIDNNPKLSECCEGNQHKTIFSTTHDEKKLLEFIKLYSQMLMHTHIKPIDTDGEYANYCFRYNKAMFMSLCWSIGIYNGQQDYIDGAMDYFNKLAEMEKIEITDLNDYDKIIYIIEYFKEKMEKH